MTAHGRVAMVAINGQLAPNSAEWRDKLKLRPVSLLQQNSFSVEKHHSEDRL